MTETPELFDDVFIYVLQFERMVQQHQTGFQPAYQEVREKIKQSLAQATMADDGRHIQAAEFDAARFAVEAWTDEVILKHRAWNHYDVWANNTLVYEDYHNRRAGVEFFDRLERLPPDQNECRKIYHRCLALGFRGRYIHDRPKLAQLRHMLAQQVYDAQSEVRNIDKLTPQPYAVLASTAGPAQPLGLYHLRVATWLLLATAPLVLLLVKLISFAPSSAPDLHLLVADALHPYQQPCTNITFGAVKPAGHVTLTGRAPNETQRHTISSAVQNVPGVRLVNNDKLEVIPRPACEALDIVEPLQKGQSPNITVTLKKGSPDGSISVTEKVKPVYHYGDNLVIEVILPFESYVYVDYYDTKMNPPSSGEVTHLFPNSFEPQNLKQPNITFMIGHPTGVSPIKIGPPTGRDLITVIASKSQLFPVSHLVVQGNVKAEPAEGYLAKLRQALQGISKTDVIATFSFLHNSGEHPKQ